MKNKKKKATVHGVMMALLAVAGVLCFVYFGMLVTYVGPQSFFFVFPVIGVACFLLALIWHGHYKGKIVLPRKLIVAFWSLVSVGVLVFGTLFGMILHGQSVGPKGDADYLIVLGAGLRGERPSLVLRNRIEAEAMRRALVQMGIDGERILIEDQSTSTHENLTFSKTYIPEGASVVIVTSKFHVYRACHLAQKCGYESVSGLGADNVRWLNPTNYLRECMAVFKDVVLK